MKTARHEILRYPSSRVGTLDIGQLALRKHHIAGLLELDVTRALAEVRKQRSQGDGLSFFAWMVKTIASAIADNRCVHAQQGRGHSTVVFEDVDLSVMVEKVVEGERVPLPLLIRRANEKKAQEIHAEIQAAQRQEVRDESDHVLTDSGPSRAAMRLYYALPQWLRLRALRWAMKSPHRRKAMMGTAIITSVGAPGHLPGWIIPKSVHNLCFALGSIAKKPWVVANRIEIRDILHLTVLFDHDVVDGMPAARFVAALAARIQRGQPADPAAAGGRGRDAAGLASGQGTASFGPAASS